LGLVQIIVNGDANRELFAANGGIGKIDSQKEGLKNRELAFGKSPSPLSLDRATARSIQVVIESGTVSLIESVALESVLTRSQIQVSGKN